MMKQLMSEGLRPTYNLLSAHVQQGETLLISSTLGFAARLIQETHRVPNVTVHLSPGVFRSAYQAPQLPGFSLPNWLPIRVKQTIWKWIDHLMIDPVVKPDLSRFRQELGLPPMSRIFHTWLHSPDLVLGLFPTWFAPAQPDWPLATALTGFPLYDDVSDSELPTTIQQCIDANPQPIVFTPGSANKHAASFFAEAAKACQDINQPGIFLTRYPEQLPQGLPPNITYFSYAPLSQLLPHCSALVHHGGIGTCSQALRAGIPQIIQPYAFDQYDNAARIEQLGVGHMISRRSFHDLNIVRCLNNLLASTEVTIACQTIKQSFIGTNPQHESCTLIEQLGEKCLLP